MNITKFLVLALMICFVSGCGQKYYKNINPGRNFNQDQAYCSAVATGSVPMPTMQQYQNNAYGYAPGGGTMRDQYGNTYRYQENYNPMAAANSYMAMGQQDLNNAAITLRNMQAQSAAQSARSAITNQCMYQLGWREVSEESARSAIPNRGRVGVERGMRGFKNAQEDHFRKIREAAEQGDAQAQYQLAYAYQVAPYGMTKDVSEAAKWYQKAAEQGYDRAQLNLGLMYALGQGVAKDEAKAVAWIQKAAAQGNKEAQNRLNEIHRKRPT